MSNPDMEQQQEFYNSYWRDLKPIGRYKLMRVQWIAQMLTSIYHQKSSSNLTLLDMGCGDGRLAPFYQAITNAATYGIELSPEAVKNAQILFPGINYVHGDATQTPYSENLFDIIVCQEVLEHIQHQQLLIKEASRILKNGGHLILTTPNKFYFDRRNGGNYSQQPIENIIDKQQLFQLLQPNFEVQSYETLIYAQGDNGVYKLLTNKYLLSFLRRVKIDKVWKQYLLQCGYGLHMAVVCTKRL